MFLGYDRAAWTTKTHSRFQPWVLVKIYSISTRANGLAYYEDYQCYLSENSVHFARRIAISFSPGQAPFPARPSGGFPAVTGAFNTFVAAFSVCSMSASLCAVEMKPASNCDGAR